MTQLDQLVAAMHASRAIYKAQNEPSDAELSEVLGEIVADEKRKLAAFDDLVAALQMTKERIAGLSSLPGFPRVLAEINAALTKAGFK